MSSNGSAKERFFRSCATGDLDAIKTDLFYNVSPFSQDKYGNNALHLACMSNQPKVLEYILKTVKTFKSDVQNKLGRTALNIAASQGAFECIEILLNNLHCDINSKDKNFKNTPLHWCVTSKCTKGVDKLLNLGADFELVNKFGKTPMQLAEIICTDSFNLIVEFVKNKNENQHLSKSLETNNTGIKTNISNPSLSKKTESSKLDSSVFKENTANCEQNMNSETLETDLTSNNLNEPFFIDISKLKDGDHSVLKLLEKSIEPIDETSFVSSILNSGKVIQLTEAGILALEYTKNEVHTPIPDRLVKSFLNTSKQFNTNKDNSPKKDDELDSKTDSKGLKRLKSPQPCSKKFKHAKTVINKKSEFENLLEQLSTKCTNSVPRIYDAGTHGLQRSPSLDINTVKNTEVCNQNQLVCLNSDTNGQSEWVEDLMCLLKDIVEHTAVRPTQ